MCAGRASVAEDESVRMTDLTLMEAAREALGFTLTGGQEQALDNVLRDLEGPGPMMCLLQVSLLSSVLRSAQPVDAILMASISPL